MLRATSVALAITFSIVTDAAPTFAKDTNRPAKSLPTSDEFLDSPDGRSTEGSKQFYNAAAPNIPQGASFAERKKINDRDLENRLALLRLEVENGSFKDFNLVQIAELDTYASTCSSDRDDWFTMVSKNGEFQAAVLLATKMDNQLSTALAAVDAIVKKAGTISWCAKAAKKYERFTTRIAVKR